MTRDAETEARVEAATWENVRPGGVPPGIVCDIAGESWDITDEINPVLHDLLAQLKEAREGWMSPEVREQAAHAIDAARRHGHFDFGWVVARLDEAADALREDE